jgi:hypothetical protein
LKDEGFLFIGSIDELRLSYEIILFFVGKAVCDD